MRWASLLRAKLLAALAFALLATGAEAREVRLYVFGNSLVNHADGGRETNVPVWLSRLARQEGQELAVDGRFGFLRNFADELPPKPDWAFAGVSRAWRGGDFAAAGFTDIVITPANFVQYAPPDAPYWDARKGGASPFSAILAVVDWLEDAAPGRRIWIYEGWADMGEIAPDFPPDAATLRRYHEANLGSYHDWYVNLIDMLREARPGAEIALLPVSSTLARLFTGPVLGDLPAEALYTDNAPHGTASLYFLAALASYGPLFGTPPPLLDGATQNLDERIVTRLPKIVAALSENFDGAENDTAAPDLPREDAQAAPPAPQPPAAPAAASPAPDPALAGIPETGLENPALAMGLNGIFDWSTQAPFIDVMKSARPWIGHKRDQWGAWDDDALRAGGHLNAQGWPVSLPEGASALEALILTDLPREATSLAGRYRMTWKGTGKIGLGGRAARVTTDLDKREAWFNFQPGDGPVTVVVRSTSPTDPIRDVTVMQERFVPLWEAGAVFNPDWLAVVRDLRAVRFMDWMFTNGSDQMYWRDRPLMTDATWAWRGVPAEVMIQLANEIGADAWFNMPHMADDAYIRTFATLVRDRLDPKLVAYVEYSNEMWNWLFPQTKWAADQARALWGRRAGDEGYLQFAGMRAARVGAIWKEVFGDAAETRLKRVIAVHTGWPGLEEKLIEAPLWRRGDREAPPPEESFDAYAVAGYFGYDLGSPDNANMLHELAAAGAEGEEAAARILRDGSLAELLDELLPHHAATARRYGYEMVMYEGGTHVLSQPELLDDDTLNDFFIRLNYSPAMAVLYDELLHGFRAAGGTLFNAFVDVNAPTRFGSWGALRYLGDDNPRWRALMSYNREATPDWERRAPGTFLQGILRQGSDGADILAGTPEEDTLIAGAGDDVLVTNGGGDHLNGGEGFDMAVLPGTPEDYTFADDGIRLSAEGATGTVTLFSVELLQFTGSPGLVLETASLVH